MRPHFKNPAHWFAAILATFVACIGLQGCSNINTASLASNQISFEQNAALLSEQTTALAASQGLLKGSALAAVVGYEAVANTAIANAKAAYESGDVNTANLDLSQAAAALATVKPLVPVVSVTTKP